MKLLIRKTVKPLLITGHNGFVNIDNVRMSKSLGSITVHDALKTIDGQVLRFFFATQHTANGLHDAVRDAETPTLSI